MGILDSLFGSGETKTSTSVKYPEWVENASQNNYKLAETIASRPYQPYAFQRIAGFTGDQNSARDLLRSVVPDAVNDARTPLKLPRMIDNIPGETPGGITDYMNPYIDQVLGRTQNRIREATDMAKKWEASTTAHGSGAFGDARHGIADGQIERAGIERMGDAAADAYSAAYDNAQGLRSQDINRMFQTAQFDRDGMNTIMAAIDALYRSGSNEQQLQQGNLDQMYQDFVAQRDYPIQQYNLMTSALTQSPYGSTSTNAQPAPSPASQGLGALASILALF